MDALDLILCATRHCKTLCPVPRDLDSVTARGEEDDAGSVGLTRASVEEVWNAVRALYRTGIHPAIQMCVRREGAVLLNRAIGYARGGGPDDPPGMHRVPATVDTPFIIYSASKAITAMVIHKLDELRVLHLDDRVADYLPEFDDHGKRWITIRHVLAHRAGIPNLPRGSLDLDLISQPERLVATLAAEPHSFRPGRRLAYHAISGGFVLGEIVRRATGDDIRTILERYVRDPLALRWFDYGVRPEEVDAVAVDAVTGPPVLPPFSWLFERALGVSLERAIELARDPRFLTGIIPAANIVCTADELCAFYQCLLNGGELNGVRVFDPRTIRHATSEQSYLEFDFTLGLPLRYGLGFMLGGETVSLYGLKTPHAFGHLGLSNIFSWADPDRRLAVALITSGKPFVGLDTIRLFGVLTEIGRVFAPVADGSQVQSR